MTISIPMPSAVRGAVALGDFGPIVAQQIAESCHLETVGSSTMFAEKQLRAAIAYSTVHKKIEAWTGLPDDWDGRGGIAIAIRTANFAKDLLRQLEARGIRVPDPYVAGDGEVGFCWTSNRGFASVSILDDGYLAALVRPGTGQPYRLYEPCGGAPINHLATEITRVA